MSMDDVERQLQRAENNEDKSTAGCVFHLLSAVRLLAAEVARIDSVTQMGITHGEPPPESSGVSVPGAVSGGGGHLPANRLVTDSDRLMWLIDALLSESLVSFDWIRQATKMTTMELRERLNDYARCRYPAPASTREDGPAPVDKALVDAVMQTMADEGIRTRRDLEKRLRGMQGEAAMREDGPPIKSSHDAFCEQVAESEARQALRNSAPSEDYNWRKYHLPDCTLKDKLRGYCLDCAAGVANMRMEKERAKPDPSEESRAALIARLAPGYEECTADEAEGTGSGPRTALWRHEMLTWTLGPCYGAAGEYIWLRRKPAPSEGAQVPALLPCPFCGAVDVDYEYGEAEARVVCRTCEAGGPLKDDGEAARAAWNTRATIDPERLADAVIGEFISRGDFSTLLQGTVRACVIDACRALAAAREG